ncbi:sensor histidine kinase [Kitasatospora sp. NPDC085879]|uniref:sensor histidine kinase n=1 Tax=Kitasatospora sp. NPDC085879 TaxID=3154769 RepID=UPI003423BB71
MTQSLAIALLWCLLAVLLLCQARLLRVRRERTDLARQVTELLTAARLRDEEAAHLATRTLPATADNLLSPPEDLHAPRHGGLAGTPFAASLDTVVDLMAVVEEARSQAEQKAHIVVSSAMDSLQALADEQQALIAAMQRRHADPDVFQGLLEIDHVNAQFGRRAQAVGLLCGAGAVRRRRPAPLTDVVRGAASRIRDYRRIQPGLPVETTVVGEAVEPVAVALAELLDNAARHCAPDTLVDVGIQLAPHGAVITIDDSGPGMDDEQLRRANAMLTGPQPATLCSLGDRPQLGLPVVGLLAARHGFRVHVGARSPHGGVQAMLLLPAELLAAAAEQERPAPDEAPTAPHHAADGLARPMAKFVRQTRNGHPAE